LSLIHEARVQFLKQRGYDELNLHGVGIIMSDAAIQFRSELFYGDTIKAFVASAEFTGVAFNLYYKLEKENDNSIVAVAKTGMVCYDYQRKKIVAVPEQVKLQLTNKENTI
jgi:acyl-CoA thioesterase FadM